MLAFRACYVGSLLRKNGHGRKYQEVMNKSPLMKLAFKTGKMSLLHLPEADAGTYWDGNDGKERSSRPETLYHRDDALLYIAYVMLISAAPIPADRWHCSLWP